MKQKTVKAGEVVVQQELDPDYIGTGKVIAGLVDDRSWKVKTVEFGQAGQRDVDSKRKEDAEVSFSSGHLTPTDALLFAKALIKAANIAKRPITQQMLEEAKKIQDERVRGWEKERELKNAIKERRALKWNHTPSINKSDLTRLPVEDTNGLISIVRNLNPKYLETTKKYLVLGPQYGSRSSYYYVGKGNNRKMVNRSEKDCWAYKFEFEKAFKTLKEAQAWAQQKVNEMLRERSPLLEEVGDTGKLVATKELKKRMRLAPLPHRENWPPKSDGA